MTAKENLSRTTIKDLGWRQGSILPLDLADRVAHKSNPAEEIIVVVSHDCDVTNANLDSEPLVELLTAKLLAGEQGDGGLLHGKNPRRIQFKVEIEGKNQYAEANACDRFFAQRDLLLDCGPDSNRKCESLAVKQLSDWLSRRYVRSAFPDTFNDRIRSAQSHMKKALKSKGQDITGVFVATESWDELPDDQPYRFIIVALMLEEDLEDTKKRTRAQTALDKIEQRLEKCGGIEIIESSLASEGDVSLADFRLMKRFDFDYLSLRDEDGDTAPRP